MGTLHLKTWQNCLFPSCIPGDKACLEDKVLPGKNEWVQRSPQNIKGGEAEVLLEMGQSSSLSFTGSPLSITNAFRVLIAPKCLGPQTHSIVLG